MESGGTETEHGCEAEVLSDRGGGGWTDSASGRKEDTMTVYGTETTAISVREAVKDRTGGGRERRKMHKQMLALGIDAISSVSQLMTNSMEKRKEQKENRNGVSKSKRKTEGLGEEELKGEQETDREKRDGCIHD